MHNDNKRLGDFSVGDIVFPANSLDIENGDSFIVSTSASKNRKSQLINCTSAIVLAIEKASNRQYDVLTVLTSGLEVTVVESESVWFTK